MHLHSKFIEFLERQGYQLSSGSFPRPCAGGTTFWRHLSGSRNKGRGTIVYLHGTGNDHFYGIYQLIVTALNQGFSFFTFDLDGHGTRSTTYLSEDSASSLLEDGIKYMNQQWPTNTVHLLCHSAGGYFTLLGLPYGKSVKSLCFLGVPFRIKLSLQGIIQEVLSIRDPIVWKFVKTWGLDSIPACGPWGRKRYPVRLENPLKNSFGYVNVMGRISQLVDIPSDLRKIKIPCLSICGAADLIAPPAPWQDQGFNNLKVIPIPRCNHFSLLFNPLTTTSYLDWLESLLETSN